MKSEIKIKIISDTHCKHSEFDYKDLECDILIHCGDATDKGNVTQLKEFFLWFVKAPAKYKLFVPGNHDRKVEHPDMVNMQKDLGIINLHNNLQMIKGFKFWGNSLVKMRNRLEREGYLPSRKERAEIWANMPCDLDFLITHTPPYGILDYASYGSKDNVGCELLKQTIYVKSPKFHIFGHIHEQGGRMEHYQQTICINAAILDRDKKNMKKPVEIIISS